MKTDVRETLRDCVAHIGHTSDAITEAQRLRDAAVVDGDLDPVRKARRRITDLTMDRDALSQGRALLEAQVAKLDSEARIAACDAAAEGMKPALEEVCGAIERLENALIAAGAASVQVDEAYTKFAAARSSCSAAPPNVPDWRAGFSLVGFKANMKNALADCSRWSLERINQSILQSERRWSAKQRDSAAFGDARD
jgi:hypothetical protein